MNTVSASVSPSEAGAIEPRRFGVPWLAVLGLAVSAAALGWAGLRIPTDPAWKDVVWVMAAAAPLVGLAAWYRPWWVVVALAAYVPLESYVLSLLTIRGLVYLALQLAGELTVYGLLVAVVVRRVAVFGRPLRRTPLDVPWVLFVAIAITSLAVNAAPPVQAGLNLRSILRFVALFYAVVQMDVTPRAARTLLAVIVLSAAVQVGLGAVQRWGGEAWREALLPREVEAELLGQSRSFILLERGRELGAVFGTLGDTLYYGLFMLVGLAVALGAWRGRRWGWAAVAGPLVLATAYSYSRAAVLAALLMLAAFVWCQRPWRRWALAGAALVGAMVLGSGLLGGMSRDYVHPRMQRQSIVSNLTGMLSEEYLERAKRQRLGAVLAIAPTSLRSAPLLGHGTAELHAIERLNRVEPLTLFKTLDKKGFEDVYWVALLSYVGLAGVAVMAWLMGRLGWSGWRLWRGGRDPTLRWAAMATLLLTVSAVFLLWFSRVLEFRAFSFYFWLLPAVMYALAAWERYPLARRTPQPTTAHDAPAAVAQPGKPSGPATP